jgi:iron complex outermembrane receptor protein
MSSLLNSARHRRAESIARIVAAAVILSAAIQVHADEATSQPSLAPEAAPFSGEASAYKKMSLDELMDIKVTSVTKRESTVRQSPAAIAVITQEDIHRSGVTNIPQALRMAPGLEVAQIDSSTWAITSRGFNSSTANKLLVLIDGRTVYTPLYSGVFWDVQDTMMQDIDRIEVIRGPAGTLWGANAVNGVINVITKDAKDTQGLLFSAGGGTQEHDFASVRYGWTMGNASMRMYAKHFDRNPTVRADGSEIWNSWSMNQTGFRTDWELTDGHFTLQGDMYQGVRDNHTAMTLEDTELMGGNLLGRWTQKLSQGDIKLQMYYDGSRRDIPNSFTETRHTYDFDFQFHIPVGAQQDVTFGLGYRMTADHIRNSPAIQFLPERRVQNLFSAFIQDEIQLIPEKLWLTLGSKFEHNDFTGFEVQPSARLLWVIDERQSAWAAVSRAVRTPTRLETDLSIFAGPVTLANNPDFVSEDVIAYEAGYRVQAFDWLSLDVATFYNDYRHLRSIESINLLNYKQDNKVKGQTYGVEIGSTIKIADWWKLYATQSLLMVQLQTEAGSTDTSTVRTSGNDPQFQAMLRSTMDLVNGVELNFDVRYVSKLTSQNVPGYVAANVRLAWKINPNLEVSIVGQNLFDNLHPEFGTSANRSEIPRGVFAELTYRW